LLILKKNTANFDKMRILPVTKTDGYEKDSGFAGDGGGFLFGCVRTGGLSG